MGRSVMTQRGAEYVNYLHFAGDVYGTYNPETEEYEGDDYNECETSSNWDDFKTELIYQLKTAFPSFDRFPDRGHCGYLAREVLQQASSECTPILWNGLAVVFLSEYCGVVSVSFVPLKEFYQGERDNLQVHWLRSIEKRINKALSGLPFGELIVPICRASNGECMYQKTAKETA